MNEMYNMSIVAHNFSVLVILGVIGINAYKLLSAKGVAEYRRFHMLYNPMGLTVLGSIIFTGVIMMAAKHLDFTFVNIIMIVVAFVFVVFEVKRVKALRYIQNDDIEKFLEYKKFSMRILLIEFSASLVLYVGMHV